MNCDRCCELCKINGLFVGCGDSTHRCRDSGTESLQKLILLTEGENLVRLLLKYE